MRNLNSASFCFTIFFPVFVSSLTVYFVMFYVDLIDMQTKPDPPYHFIGHVVNHFTKFRVLFPLENKSANEVAKHLIEKVFSLFGLSIILHSGNGTEFVNEIIQATVLLWSGKCSLVNGNPGHSKSQGLVEQGNRTVEFIISARKAEAE